MGTLIYSINYFFKTVKFEMIDETKNCKIYYPDFSKSVLRIHVCAERNLAPIIMP